jgi:hypothetical protein
LATLGGGGWSLYMVRPCASFHWYSWAAASGALAVAMQTAIKTNLVFMRDSLSKRGWGEQAQ